MEQQETPLVTAFDANGWIYQTWTYNRHDVGTTPGFDGDTAKALASIKAKTLILTGTKDLRSPEFESIETGQINFWMVWPKAGKRFHYHARMPKGRTY